ncbi:MAG: aspartate kinase [Chloroflexi bacterium]|nr:aspartate kinase [Chloroflexota bacterium]
MLVMKFGGTSVGSQEAFRQVIKIVQDALTRDPQVVVVVSAMSGVTNALIEGATAASRGDHETYQRLKSELLSRHLSTVDQLSLSPAMRLDVSGHIEDRLHDFDRFCRSVAILRELTPRGLDLISALGERLSVVMIAAALSSAGIKAQAVEATELIVTDDNFGQASPLMEETKARTEARLGALLARGIVPVVTGFIGATPEGVTTTLGRSGSDYTAAILGACLAATEIYIWKEVDGIMTADPRIVKEAYTLPEMTYAEAAELAYFGAQVLHPKTIAPAAELGIPLRTVNTFNPAHPGTVLVRERQNTDKRPIQAVSVIKALSLITVEGRGMLGVPGIAARTFAAVARRNANVLMISQSSSEQHICFVVPLAAAKGVIESLEDELRLEMLKQNIDRIGQQAEVAIVAVVGEGIAYTPGVAAQIVGALGKRRINIVAVAQGSSACNFSMVVDIKDADDAVRAIHQDVLMPINGS